MVLINIDHAARDAANAHRRRRPATGPMIVGHRDRPRSFQMQIVGPRGKA